MRNVGSRGATQRSGPELRSFRRISWRRRGIVVLLSLFLLDLVRLLLAVCDFGFVAEVWYLFHRSASRSPPLFLGDLPGRLGPLRSLQLASMGYYYGTTAVSSSRVCKKIAWFVS